MQAVKPGFFGKLPTRGDFVVRRLDAEFVERWDEWLQAALAQSRHAFGEEWLSIYLTSPIWRFAVSPGFCGPSAYCGVLVPSVDRVGRYFPLIAAASCDAHGALPLLAQSLDSWYSSVEDLLLQVLAETPLELDEFDARLAALQPGGAGADVAHCDWRLTKGALHWQCALLPDVRIDESLSALLGTLLSHERQRYGLWWTQGSERVEASVLLTDGFPAPASFPAMLDGRWGEPWVTARLTAGARPARARNLVCRSAALTDSGNERAINEDSFACRDDLGVWMVADGLGGHVGGQIASRMVTSVVEALGGEATLNGRAEELARSVRVVNGCLQVLGESNASGAVVGTTVAVLVVDDAERICLWAGDSRIYRLRAGVLEQLSRDHAPEDGEPGNHFITRAVGGPGELLLERERGDVVNGDRYLLCSDGLYGELAPEQIAAALAHATPEAGCAALRSTALSGTAPDNLTGVIVHVSTRSETAR